MKKDIYIEKNKKDFMNVVKIDKLKIKYIINYSLKDNFDYGLVYELMYIYGKRVSEVYNLHSSDIDLNNKSITFKIDNAYVEYPLLANVEEHLTEHLNNHSEGYLFKHIALDMDNFASKLNYYLKRFDDYCNVHITPRDFKRLRGQHLILDGVSVNIVQSLFCGKDICSTKRFLNYNGLIGVNEGIDSLDCVFSDFTDV